MKLDKTYVDSASPKKEHCDSTTVSSSEVKGF